jgi:hypothetical protein
MKPHLNANGEPCRCGFGKFQDPYTPQPLQREAGAKLDWLREREDKFFKSEEGQLAFEWLEKKVEGNEKLDPLAPWIWRELKKGRIQPRQPGGWSPGHLSHLADWFASNSPTRRGVDIMQLTSDEALEKLKEWDVELASKMDEAQTEGGTVVAKLDDGWTIRQITNADEAKTEGGAMGHCVGGYGGQIQNGHTLIYSLRDPKNQPHGTIQIDPVEIGYDYDWEDDAYIDEPDKLDPNALETLKRNEAVLKELKRDIKLINLVGHDWAAIKAYKDTGVSNEEFGKFLTNLCEANNLEYKPLVQVVRAFLEGRSRDELSDETLANHLTRITPDGGNVVQIQGKENKMLVPKYREMVGEWLISMDSPPGYERTVQNIWIPAPKTVQELKIWINPQDFDEENINYNNSEYEHEKVTPTRNWEDYFPDDQEHGYLHDPDGEGYCVKYDREFIRRDNWEEIIDYAFKSLRQWGSTTGSIDKLPELAKKADEFTPDRMIYRDRSYYDDFVAEVNDYIKEQLYPEFEARYYDPNSYLSEAQQWARVPEFRYADQLLGHNYIDPHEPDPAKPNLDQNKLFGPIAPTEDQERDVQRRIEMREREGIEVPGETEGEQIRNVWNEIATEQWENSTLGPKADKIVPWSDPENYDNQLGRFGKRFLKWFRRKANILDEVSDQLDPKVWDDAYAPNPVLRPEINSWVTNFIIEALDHNGYTHMEDWLELIVTGSLTTYQYSPASDFDVSLFVNADKFPEWSRAEMIAIMMDECDNIPVPGTGHPLQCYVVAEGFEKTDLYKPGLRSAYDLSTDTWIVPPEKERSRNVIKEMNEVHTIALENADKMEGLIRYEPFKAVQYYNQLHRRRKNDMEQGKGDFSPSNISYKMIEERGLIDQIHGIMKQYNID